MELKWTDERPTVSGCYLFTPSAGCKGRYKVFVAKGRWENAQNPELIYVNGFPTGYTAFYDGPIERIEGLWFGPIPDPAER